MTGMNPHSIASCCYIQLLCFGAPAPSLPSKMEQGLSIALDLIVRDLEPTEALRRHAACHEACSLLTTHDVAAAVFAQTRFYARGTLAFWGRAWEVVAAAMEVDGRGAGVRVVEEHVWCTYMHAPPTYATYMHAGECLEPVVRDFEFLLFCLCSKCVDLTRRIRECRPALTAPPCVGILAVYRDDDEDRFCCLALHANGHFMIAHCRYQAVVGYPPFVDVEYSPVALVGGVAWGDHLRRARDGRAYSHREFEDYYEHRWLVDLRWDEALPLSDHDLAHFLTERRRFEDPFPWDGMGVLGPEEMKVWAQALWVARGRIVHWQCRASLWHQE